MGHTQNLLDWWDPSTRILWLTHRCGLNCSRISSVGRALDCRAGGLGFNSQAWANTQGLEITEK